MAEPNQSESPQSAANTSEETLVQSDRQRNDSQRMSARNALAGLSLPGYETVECLGEGAFGSVWLARERKTGKHVAIKFFTRQRGLDWTLLTREVEKLAVLDASRDVVRLFDVGWDHDPPYFVMEYLEAGSVAVVLEQGPLSVRKAIDVTKSIARALVHAHGAGILHCDIKPANVLLDRGGAARLGDFGQSRLTTELSPALGTLFYMAPEQAVLKGIPDARWDVYSLGALLFHMLTGRPPYRTPQAEQLLTATDSLESRLDQYRRIIEASPLPEAHRHVKGVDRALIEIIDGCLQPNPQERLPNAQVVLDLLERRDLQWARRPLIWLGFLGPLLLMLVVAWIASTAVPKAVAQAGQNLYERALASDAATVKILANSIGQELADRQFELKQLAQQIAASEGQNPYGLIDGWEQTLEAWNQQMNERLTAQGRTLDQSLLFTDAHGIQRLRLPPDPDTLNVSWAHRDYFHGLGRDLLPTNDLTHIAPRRTPGISVAFRSGATGQYMVAIAVPVWDPSHQRVLGVLARTIHLTDLLSQWEQQIQVRGNGAGMNGDADGLMLSLVDTREESALLLDHHWITEAHVRDISDDQLKKFLSIAPDRLRALQSTDRNASYIDPISEKLAAVHDPEAQLYTGPWLAAFQPVGQTGWIAIVQERRALVVAPMLDLYDVFLRYGLWTLIVFTGMLAALWLLIQRATLDDGRG